MAAEGIYHLYKRRFDNNMFSSSTLQSSIMFIYLQIATQDTIGGQLTTLKRRTPILGDKLNISPI